MASILWLFLIVLPHPGLSAPRLKDIEICMMDNAKLQHRIKVLQNLLLLGELQIQDLTRNNYHSVKSKVFKSSTERRRPEVQLPSTGGNLIVYDEDCSSVFESGKRESGYYRIQPKPENEPFLVYCEMSDGGGWTVIQRRSNGKVNFNRHLFHSQHEWTGAWLSPGQSQTSTLDPTNFSDNKISYLNVRRDIWGFEREWDDYKQGFGLFKSRRDEYWLGNNHIYDLLDKREMSLQIDLMDWEGNRRYAIYDQFRIANEKDNYRLWVGYCSGNAGDGLSGGSNFGDQWSASLKGMMFSTSDKDNDRYIQGNCAVENKCGWWFNRCHLANLNGLYYKTGNYSGQYDNGIVWSTWRGLWYSLKQTVMKIRSPSYLGAGSGNGKDG